MHRQAQDVDAVMRKLIRTGRMVAEARQASRDRDEAILEAISLGLTYRAIAQAAQLTVGRIAQIVAKYEQAA
jgi:DNA-binding NarL/FixJ family response regulator